MSSIFRNSSTRSSMAAKFALIKGYLRSLAARSRCATDIFFSFFRYASLDFFLSSPLFDLLLMLPLFLLLLLFV